MIAEKLISENPCKNGTSSVPQRPETSFAREHLMEREPSSIQEAELLLMGVRDRLMKIEQALGEEKGYVHGRLVADETEYEAWRRSAKCAKRYATRRIQHLKYWIREKNREAEARRLAVLTGLCPDVNETDILQALSTIVWKVAAANNYALSEPERSLLSLAEQMWQTRKELNG